MVAGVARRGPSVAGTLKQHLARYAEFLTLKRVKEFARLILAGLVYLHGQRIVRGAADLI